MTNNKDINVCDFLDRQADKTPYAPAVIYPERKDRKGRTAYTRLSYEQLVIDSKRMASGLKKIGIKKGTRCVLMVPPSLDFMGLAFGLIRLGAVPILVDPGMGLRSLKNCLHTAKPNAFIGTTKAHLARCILGWAKQSNEINITVGMKLFWGGHTYENIYKKGSLDDSFSSTTSDDTAAIAFTSGSTGIPKGVLYQHKQFAGQIQLLKSAFDIQEGEIDLSTFPLFTLFNPAMGVCSVIPDMDPTRPGKVNPKNIVDPIRDLGITHMFGSPALLKRVGEYASKQNIKLPSLKRILSAGAPVPASTLKLFHSSLNPKAEIFTPYGATEALPVSCIGSREILTDTCERSAQGKGTCIGRPIPGNDLRIIPISDETIHQWTWDLELPPGEIGEIVVRGPSVTKEYFNNPGATKLAKIPIPGSNDVWHRMGDLGYFDEKGRVWFCGRMSQRVRLSTETLFTVPCEAVFNTHPQVLRTALVEVHKDRSSSAALCVELRSPAKGEARKKILEELNSISQKHPHTQSIQHILFHRSFPVDIRHNSKIFREKLAIWAQKEIESGAGV